MEGEAYLNFVLLSACVVVGYLLIKKIFFDKEAAEPKEVKPPEIEPRDFTLEELREFDGSDPSKPILVALNGTVYDVTRSKNMYGPEGPYQMFAGRDASRAFATLNLSKDDLRESWDDLSDLSKGEQSTLKEWEEKYLMKYKRIGELLKDRDKKND